MNEISSKNKVHALTPDGKSIEFTGTLEYIKDGYFGVRDPAGGVWEWPTERVVEAK